MQPTSNLNVLDCRRLPAPEELLAALPASDSSTGLVARTRRAIRDIFAADDPRLLVVVGPCSIHDVAAARDYATRLAGLARQLDDRLLVVMRAYFEKPRTAIGWQGLILDPSLDGTGNIARGLWLARAFLCETLDLGLPTATEFLDPVSPQYIADLVCWAAIGARTSESQMHRQLASGLSMPVGFKNGTEGTLHNAVNAIKAAARPQAFFGIGADGHVAAVRTCGNSECHMVLRGGASGPNYSPAHIAGAEALLHAAGLRRALMVDCSHDNSGRHPERQPGVLAEVVKQMLAGCSSIKGVMMESNLHGGSEPLDHRGKPRYGVSITDACLDWSATEQALRQTHAALAPRFVCKQRRQPAATVPLAAGTAPTSGGEGRVSVSQVDQERNTIVRPEAGA